MHPAKILKMLLGFPILVTFPFVSIFRHLNAQHEVISGYCGSRFFDVSMIYQLILTPYKVHQLIRESV